MNFFKLILQHPCADPWSVYFETALPALIKLAITLATFDIFDASQEQLRLWHHGGGLIGKRGRRHARGAEMDEEEGKKSKWFQASEFEGKSYIQKLTKGLLFISDPLQRIGFIWMLFSAVDDFFYDWTSLLMSRNFCEARADSGPFQADGENGDTNWSKPGTALSFPEVRQNRSHWGFNGFSCACPGGQYTIIVSCSTTSHGNPAPTAFLQLHALFDGVFNLSFDGDKVPLVPDVSTDVVANFSVDARLAVSVAFDVSTNSVDAPIGTAELSSWQMTVYQSDWT